jgi:hypothetical protein
MQAYTKTDHGSWTSVHSDTAAEESDALALPGSWTWWPRRTVLVRRDQLANLPPPVPLPPPFATDILPTTGPLSGGTPTVVLVQAPGAADVTAVMYGSRPGTSVSASNPNQVRSTSPPGDDDEGATLVTVVTPRGPSNAVQFYYQPAGE